MKKTNKILAILALGYIGHCYACDPQIEFSSTISDTSSNESMVEIASVNFQNPCFNKYSNVSELNITNGSMMNFASKGMIGKTIRAAEAMNDIPNPLGITHSGIIFVDSPKWVYNTVLHNLEQKTGNVLTSDAAKAILKELQEYHGPVIAATYGGDDNTAPFSLESDGSAREVLKGIMPHVHIHDLNYSLTQYGGNVYVRTLEKPVLVSDSRNFIQTYLGSKYESVFKLGELLKATEDKNTTENSERLFCSELAALFYKNVGVISNDVNTSNVIPEEFSANAGEFDMLLGKASNDIVLKYKYDFSDNDIEGTSPWGYITRGFVSVVNRCFPCI